MDIPILIKAFLAFLAFIFGVAAFVLIPLGLLVIFLRVISVLAEAFLKACFWLGSGLIHGIFNLSGRAADITRKLLVAPAPILEKEKADNKLPFAARLLASILSDEDRENIIGDVSEEYQQFFSKKQANFWLYKQVLKSVLPLAYKSVKSRLASYFGERVR